MKTRIVLAGLLVSALLLSSGCLRIVKWQPPATKYPIIPMEAYPEFALPEDMKTEEDMDKIVDALYKTEKHTMMLRARIEKYNEFAKSKNLQAKDLFK